MGKTKDKEAVFRGLVTLSETVADSQAGEGGEKRPRRFELVGHSGNVLSSWFGDWIIDLAGIRHEEKIPVLLEHDYKDVLGYCDSVSIDPEKGLIMSGVFCDTKNAAEVISLLEQGFPYQASIGVRPEEILYLDKKEQAVVNNKLVNGELDIWKKSYVREVSFTVLGKDENTSASLLSENQKGENMGKENQNLTAQTDTPVIGIAENSNTAALGQEDMQKLKDDAVQAERQRIAEISRLCAKFDLQELSQECIEKGLSLEQARALVLENLSVQNAKLGSASVTEDEKDKFLAACVDGLALSMGYRKKTDEKLAAGHEEFRNCTFQSIARNLLEREGVRTLNMSKVDIADRILGRTRLSASTSDFKGIFLDAMNKVLAGTYEQQVATWKPIVEVIPANDFKPVYGIEVSGGSDLEEVGENEEYKIGKFVDGKEQYALKKRGRIFEISFEMMVNDDMGVLRRFPMMFAAIAARSNSQVVWSLLNDNPKLSDGKALFSTEHGNIGDASGGLTSDNLEKAVDLLSAQKGLQGEILALNAEYLLCSPADRIKAEILLNSASLPKENFSAGTYNPWSQSGIKPVVEERLRKAADGKKYFYVMANPFISPVIGVSFLNGKESPDIVEDTNFDTDGIRYKIRNVMNAGILSSRGIVRMEIK